MGAGKERWVFVLSCFDHDGMAGVFLTIGFRCNFIGLSRFSYFCLMLLFLHGRVHNVICA